MRTLTACFLLMLSACNCAGLFEGKGQKIADSKACGKYVCENQKDCQCLDPNDPQASPWK